MPKKPKLKSKYTGITFTGTAWQGQLPRGYCPRTVGCYATPEEAARAYDWGLIDHGKEPVNFLPDYLKKHGRPTRRQGGLAFRKIIPQKTSSYFGVTVAKRNRDGAI